MSWLFGLRKDPNSMVPAVPDDNNSNNGQSGQQQPSQNEKSRPSEAYRFDSSALERAAQAAKDLEKSSKTSILKYMSKIISVITFFSQSSPVKHLSLPKPRSLQDSRNSLPKLKSMKHILNN